MKDEFLALLPKGGKGKGGKRLRDYGRQVSTVVADRDNQHNAISAVNSAATSFTARQMASATLGPARGAPRGQKIAVAVFGALALVGRVFLAVGRGRKPAKLKHRLAESTLEGLVAASAERLIEGAAELPPD